MMKRIGSKFIAILMVLAALCAGNAHAAVTATVDRTSVSMGDSLQLTLSASDDEDLDERGLAPLQKDFEILQRSTSSNTTIVNGHFSQSHQMSVELTPRREGNLQIPALEFDGSATAPLTIAVGTASDTRSDGQAVEFEAEVDRDSVYVQGEVILTLRVQLAVSLEDGGIPPLKLDNAFVKPLQQHSYRRTVNGQQRQIYEVRYAIFPEQSGTLEIPAQVFTGRVVQGRRSFFDMGRGQQVRRVTQPLSVTVLPKPATFGDSDWLPARSLTVQETWSTEPENLRVGESITRTIKIIGEGLQGAQLPPTLFAPTEGLKYYPDQPKISEQETSNGLEGLREDSAALVPTQAGQFVLPQIRIPWWDTQSNQIQYAVVPERTITVLPAEPGQGSPVEPAPAPVASNADVDAPSVPPAPASSTTSAPSPALPQQPVVWQLISAISTLGWLLTLLFLWRRRTVATTVKAANMDNMDEKEAFKQLLTACTASNAAAARAAIIGWATASAPARKIVSLGQVATHFGDQELTSQLDALDTALYRPEGSSWEGGPLADCVRRLRSQSSKQTGDANELQLYPVAGNARA